MAQTPSSNVKEDASRKAELGDTGYIPIGGIIPFYGDFGDWPENFVLCDGKMIVNPKSQKFNKRNAPELTDRFIMGINQAQNLIEQPVIGGSVTHHHQGIGTAGGAKFKWERGRTRASYDSTRKSKVGEFLDHTHNVGLSTDESKHIPPYMGLFYIMRIY